ncbi:hypothetical protein [Streptomyces sp. NPDC093589]|uniref:hypothetical protein n=1 Tax=Streptomyces sp. NPDC093589 TaxID=3366043 RepID=UPI003822E20F
MKAAESVAQEPRHPAVYAGQGIMKHQWKYHITAFIAALSIFFTGGMAAAAAEPPQSTSALEKCRALPLKEKISCLKKSLRDDKAVAGVSLVVLFIAEHEWHEETKSGLPALSRDSQKIEKLIQGAAALKLKAEDFKDPKVGARAVALQKEQVQLLEKGFNLFYNPALHASQLAKSLAELTVLLAPVVEIADQILTDPELKEAFDKMNVGFSQMDQALTGLNADVAQLN